MSAQAKNFREAHGLSQSEMALLIGANLSQLKLSEVQSRQLPPDSSNLADLLEATWVNLSARYADEVSVAEWARNPFVTQLRKDLRRCQFQMPRLEKKLEQMKDQYRNLFLIMELVSGLIDEATAEPAFQSGNEEAIQRGADLVYLNSIFRKKIRKVDNYQQLLLTLKIEEMVTHVRIANQWIERLESVN